MNKKSTYEKEILKVIKKYRLFVISDIFAFYKGIKSSQFYNLELEKSEAIKEAINNNRTTTRHSLVYGWAKSGSFTPELAVYKLICSDEDRRKLSQTYQDHSSQDGSMTPKIIVQSATDKENIDKI